jgi:hypothetical protein
MNKPKIKGTTAETAVVSFLRKNGWPHAERLALQGKHDKGDITGCIGLVFEVKNYAVSHWPQWLREAETERVNAGADFGIVVAKPPGVGVTRVGDWWAGMYLGCEEAYMCGSMGFDYLWVRAGLDRSELHRAKLLGHQVNLGLPMAMRQLKTFQGQARFGVVEISPKGVKDRTLWYNVTTLDQMTRLLRLAGFGSPEV